MTASSPSDTLNTTAWCIIYQQQILQIFQHGFNKHQLRNDRIAYYAFLSCLQQLASTLALAEISCTPLLAASFMMGVMRPLSVATAIEMWIESSAHGPSPDQVTFTSGISCKEKKSYAKKKCTTRHAAFRGNNYDHGGNKHYNGNGGANAIRLDVFIKMLLMHRLST